jgi:hypothetical protein
MGVNGGALGIMLVGIYWKNFWSWGFGLAGFYVVRNASSILLRTYLEILV